VRTAPSEQLGSIIKKTLADATTACSVKNVDMKKALVLEELNEVNCT
jgi:hypothetical protein